MKKLLMGTWLLAMPTAYAAEQDKRLADWAGSKKMFTYASALAHALDMLVVIIAHDSYAHNGIKDGADCFIETSDDLPSSGTGCSFTQFTANSVNTSLIGSYRQTIKTAQNLEQRVRYIYLTLIQYQERRNSSRELYNHLEACSALSAHSNLIANGYYGDFVDRYNTEHAAFNDKMRKRIIKVYFYAVKRAYGTYAAYMNRIAKRIKKEHNCEM